MVPQRAISELQDRNQIAVVGPDNKVALHQLVTSGTYGDKWVVDSGLNAGDRVIVQGTEKARPGATVKPVDAQLPAQAAQPASGAAPGAAPAAADAGASGVAASSNPAPASAASGA